MTLPAIYQEMARSAPRWRYVHIDGEGFGVG